MRHVHAGALSRRDFSMDWLVQGHVLAMMQHFSIEAKEASSSSTIVSEFEGYMTMVNTQVRWQCNK